MGLIVASIRNQRAPGASATTLTDDIKLGFTAHSFQLDTFGDLVASASDTFQGVVDEVTNVRYSDVDSNPLSTIDGDDLYDFLPNIGIPQFITNNALTVDNQPKAFSLTQPLSPFPNDPSKNYGLPPNKGVQFTVDWLADTTIDDRFYDLTVEGVSETQNSPIGYCRFLRDAFTAAVGGDNFTDITGTGKRLLGVANFETTEFDALAASAAADVTTIRNQAVLYSNDIKVGPYKTYRAWSKNNHYKPAPLQASGTGNQLNLGHSFQDFGTQNQNGPLGLNIAGANVKIRTTGGAANAARVNVLVLK